MSFYLDFIFLFIFILFHIFLNASYCSVLIQKII